VGFGRMRNSLKGGKRTDYGTNQQKRKGGKRQRKSPWITLGVSEDPPLGAQICRGEEKEKSPVP